MSTPTGKLGDFLGMPVIIDKAVPAGKVFIIDGKLWTSMNWDQLSIKVWVGNMARSVRARIAELVAESESRWGLSPSENWAVGDL